jgi:hypothetical protein
LIGGVGPIYLWIEDLYGESVAEVEQSPDGASPDEVSSLLGLALRRNRDRSAAHLSPRQASSARSRAPYPVGGFELTMTLRRRRLSFAGLTR